MKTWHLLPAAALALSATVLAQPASQPGFETLDANRDGSITRQEALEAPLLWAAFPAADRNGDGRLDRQEFEEEMALGAAMHGDAERQVAFETGQAESASAGGSAAAQSASTGASAPRGPSPLFRQLDRDRDGFLSGAELETGAALRGNWMAIDRDRDGRISPAEFGAFPSR